MRCPTFWDEFEKMPRKLILEYSVCPVLCLWGWFLGPERYDQRNTPLSSRWASSLRRCSAASDLRLAAAALQMTLIRERQPE